MMSRACCRVFIFAWPVLLSGTALLSTVSSAAGPKNDVQVAVEKHIGISFNKISRSVLSVRNRTDREAVAAALRAIGSSKFYDELNTHFSETIQSCVAGGVSKESCESVQSDLVLRVQFTEKIRNVVEKSPQTSSDEVVALGIMSLSSQADEFLLPKYVAWRKKCENNRAVNTPACREELSTLMAVREKLRASEELAVARVNGNVTKALETAVREGLNVE